MAISAELIHLRPLETIVITTRSSVYELVVLGGDRGDVLVRGGRYFSEVTPALFLGSIADDGSAKPHTIDIGLRMKFVVGERFVVTSPVQSVSHDNVRREQTCGISTPAA